MALAELEIKLNPSPVAHHDWELTMRGRLLRRLKLSKKADDQESAACLITPPHIVGSANVKVSFSGVAIYLLELHFPSLYLNKRAQLFTLQASWTILKCTE